jgi:hypothetical protein
VHLKKTKPAKYEEIEGQKVLVSPPHVKAIAIYHEDISEAWSIFSSALNCYDYFHRKELKNVHLKKTKASKFLSSLKSYDYLLKEVKNVCL